MNKLLLACWIILSVFSLHAQKPASISATVKGYNGKVVDFEFMNQDGINMQFPYREGQEMSFESKLNGINLIKVNAYVWICVRPGDQIHADIRYDGRNYQTAEFSGTPEMVIANNVVRDMRNYRIANQYKMNPLAAIVTQVPMMDYYKGTQVELENELRMLEAKKQEIPADVYNYLYAEHQSLLLSNLILCPEMFAGRGAEKQLTYPEGYWNILDRYTLSEDKNTLKSRAYMDFLLTYKKYMQTKTAHEKGVEYVRNVTMKEEYDDITTFYTGILRENALFVFLYNQMTGGRDFAMIEPLAKDYLKNYAKNKYFKKTLTDMMQ